MCGIIGMAGGPASPERRRALIAGLSTLIPRGPDGRGTAEMSNALFGHQRLSIIDLVGGSQPMEDSAGNFVITFNGEIYNYRELRATLTHKGHSFRTQSDTEVILEAYRAYGYDCVNHLDGMFAFGLWDKQKKELYLARDRFGEKPLYYVHTDKDILFASEIKAILATGLVEPILDPVSLDNYVTLSYVPPWRSIYKTITPLLPAHYAVFKEGALTQKRYWQLRRIPPNVSLKEAADTVRTMLEKSVRSRLIADVEVGTFLSGGVDSSIVTALAKKAVPRKLKAFSAGFEDFINELPYAKQIAQQHDVEHYTTHIRTDLPKALHDVSSYFDEPFADSSSIPTHLLSAFAREHVPVSLSGDGGDELFFGYGHYRAYWNTSLPCKLIHGVRDALYGYHPYHLELFFSSAFERKGLWKNPSYIEDNLASYFDFSEAETPLQRINLIDFSMTLPGDILTKVDRASMMHSLEVRSPFLQHTLAEFVYNLPDEYKTSRESGKIVLACAFEDLLSSEVFTRKKQGFGAPISAWLRKNEIRPLVDSLIGKKACISTLMKEKGVHGIVTAFINGDDRLARRVWTLLSLELWLKTHPESHL